MNCPRCSQITSDDAKFCVGCGAKLVKVCPGCQHPAELSFRFCSQCGQELTKSAPSPEAPAGESRPKREAPLAADAVPAGERRHATVLFSDLSGYTAMNEKLDPEEVERIMGGIKTEAVRIVESHGGIVNQFVGDEVLALFGIPTAHEDDPRRAVLAALELHELVRGVSPGVEEKIGRTLRLHSGINTGLIVTNLRDSRDGRFGITGDTVNTGARLKALAGDDEVLVSPDSRRMVEPYFRLEALPATELKGKQGALIPYRIAGESGARNRLEVSARRGFTRFTGRGRDLTHLQACLEKALSGDGQFVTVVGEAGIGKSRLLHEFRAGLDTERNTVLEGQCQPSGRNTQFLPHIAALRQGLRLAENEDSDETSLKAAASLKAINPALERYLPLFLHLLSVDSAQHRLPRNLTGEELRRELQLALAALITASSAERPVVLFYEDWHWADEASDAALAYLAGVISTQRVLVVVTHRDGYEGGWGHAGNHSRIDLRSLDVRESEEVIKASLDADFLPAGLAHLIYERTGGNPFFIEEICTSLLERGAVRVRDARQAVLSQTLDSLALPETVHAVVRSRLDLLDPELQECLQLAAVVGRDFSGRILEKLAAEPGTIGRSLERLKTLDLIRQTRLLPEPEYAFRQLATQEVAYEVMLLQRRGLLHLKAAEAIEEIFPERASDLADPLARHYFHGGAWGKAARHFLVAAERAKAHYAYRSALGLCRKALEAIEKGERLAEERVRTLVLLGDLRSLLGELEPANGRYREALPLAEPGADEQFIRNKIHHPHSVTRNGAKIVYYEHGSGAETLLFVNPIIYGLGMFQPILEHLCQEFRVITVDLRGTGASDPLPRRYRTNDHMEDVRAIIEDTEAAPLTAVGISRGANLLVNLALAHPALIARLVTVGGPLDDGTSPSGAVAGMRWSPEFMAARKAKDMERMLPLFIETIISEPGTEALVETTLEAFRRIPVESVLSFFSSDPDMNIAGVLSRVKVPTLVMHGSQDRRVPVEAGHYLAENIPNAQLYLFEERAHLPQMTAPGEFCEVLRQFVQEGFVPESRKAEQAASPSLGAPA